MTVARVALSLSDRRAMFAQAPSAPQADEERTMATDLSADGGVAWPVGSRVVGKVVAIGDGMVSEEEFTLQPGWVGKVVLVEPDGRGEPLRIHVEIPTGNAGTPEDGIVQVYEGDEIAASVEPAPTRDEVVVDEEAKEMAEAAGFAVVAKDGGWLWEGQGTDSSTAFDAVDGRFGTEAAAWDSAAFEAASMVMGAHDLPSEAWDGMDHEARMQAARSAFGPSTAP